MFIIINGIPRKRAFDFNTFPVFLWFAENALNWEVFFYYLFANCALINKYYFSYRLLRWKNVYIFLL